MRASITFAAGQSSEIGRYDVPCEESLPGLGMGMTNEVFQIEGIRLDLKESLKRAVRYSVALGPRFFKWKMLSRSGPKALLLLQLLIALVTIAVVNVGAVSCDLYFESKWSICSANILRVNGQPVKLTRWAFSIYFVNHGIRHSFFKT